MCGRYTLSYTMEEILAYFRVQQLILPLEPRFNIAPSQVVPIIITAQVGEEGMDGPIKEGTRVITAARWGFVPDWVKDVKKFPPMINARAETIAEKNSYRYAFRRRRCIIPATGFYEWLGTGKERLPFYIGMKDKSPIGFAGLYEDWTSPDGSMIRTNAIITVGANRLMESFHDRMPAILSADQADVWLNSNENDLAKLQGLLRPYPDRLMEAFRVSKRVNGTSFDDRDLARGIEVGEPEWVAPPKEKVKKPAAKPVESTPSAPSGRKQRSGVPDAKQLSLFALNEPEGGAE